MATFRHDVLIIGSGAAGLTTALRLPDDCRIALLSKGELTSASTYYAQGGVAAVLDQKDSLESHVADTHVAGGGLCHDDAVRYTVENGPDAIRWLIDLGVDFTRLAGNNEGSLPYHLTREGGHSHRRIIHAADATGKAISGTLIGQVRNRPNVTRFEYRVAVDLILQEHNGEKRCCGAYVHNIDTGETDVILARAVVLATGGASKVYLYTSNPDVATGDGIAMAWRAGCRVANMEFMQFHPTCLYHPKAKSFLITEAIRGEGGRLLLPNGERFMPRFDERAELAAQPAQHETQHQRPDQPMRQDFERPRDARRGDRRGRGQVERLQVQWEQERPEAIGGEAIQQARRTLTARQGGSIGARACGHPLGLVGDGGDPLNKSIRDLTGHDQRKHQRAADGQGRRRSGCGGCTFFGLEEVDQL